MRPEISIIGVEPVDSDAMARSLEAGRRVTLAHVGLFADGVAVKQVGEETFRLCRELVDEMVLVDTDAICAAIKDVFEDTRSILEPAGALAIAGVKAYVERQRVARQDAGRDRLRRQHELRPPALRRRARRARRGARGDPRGDDSRAAGQLPRVLRAARRAQRHRVQLPQRRREDAHVFVGVEVANRHETAELLRAMHKRRIEACDLTDNEMAKLHVRHLVGGRAPAAEHELLYRFEFPERPGALMHFLDSMSRGWNISLFHYRNHGADYGRVLVGMQVPPRDHAEFQRFLDRLGYRYVDESANPAYRMFLGL